MSRNKARGTTFERLIADQLATSLNDDRIDRAPMRGNADRGDIAGVRTALGGKVAIECKQYGGKYLVGPWLNEAEVERGNADAVAGVVVAKRRGYGQALDQVVFMTVRDLIALLGGESS